MSKIYRITGNFMLYGEWADPDPSFAGWICEEDEAEGEFYGFCEEFQHGRSIFKKKKIRYLAGAFAPNSKNGNRGIAFYKMSNDPNQDPLMYIVPDLTDPNCSEWAAPSIFDGMFHRQGKALISVVEDSSGKTEKYIQRKFDKLSLDNQINFQLLSQVYYCTDILMGAH